MPAVQAGSKAEAATCTRTPFLEVPDPVPCLVARHRMPVLKSIGPGVDGVSRQRRDGV